MTDEKVRAALEGLLETIEHWQENGNLIDVAVDLAATVIDARAVIAESGEAASAAPELSVLEQRWRIAGANASLPIFENSDELAGYLKGRLACADELNALLRGGRNAKV